MVQFEFGCQIDNKLILLSILVQHITVRGTSVTSTTVEWVMAELMHRLEIKLRVQEELKKQLVKTIPLMNLTSANYIICGL